MTKHVFTLYRDKGDAGSRFRGGLVLLVVVLLNGAAAAAHTKSLWPIPIAFVVFALLAAAFAIWEWATNFRKRRRLARLKRDPAYIRYMRAGETDDAN